MGKEKKTKISLFFLFSYIIFVPLINGFMKLLEKAFKADLNTIDIKNIVTTKQNAKIEVEGINLKKKDGTYGTADWGNKEEIQEYLSIGKRDGIILGETEEHEIITLPMDTYLNKNIAVFGSSGSRKSRGFAIPNGIELAQEELIKRNMSMVFTDPKRRVI